MSTEYTSSSSGVHPDSFSNSSFSSYYTFCKLSVSSNVIFTAYTCISIFLLFPLFILILFLGFQRRHGTMSHPDFFTYNMMVVELSGVLGSAVYTLGSYTHDDDVLMLGVLLSSIMIPGQTLFHLLTCVERYLAVVHPVTYMRLRESSGVRIRNIITVCVWVLCFGWVGASAWFSNNFPIIPFFSVLAVCVSAMLYCSVSVLFVLIRPGPGEAGGNRVDQAKRRAFQMIVAISGTLMLRSVGLLLSVAIEKMESFGLELCPLVDSGIWMMVPSSLVLPVLYLQRAGKLSCCRKTVNPRQE